MTFENIPYKIYLSEQELPAAWYNVRADMKHKPDRKIIDDRLADLI